MLEKLRHWWQRPCGFREVLVLSLPLIVSTLSWTLMQFTDRVFLLWYSESAVAAALPAIAVSFTVICFPLGIASYVNTFVAQYYGAGRPERIGAAVWQGVFVGLGSVPLVLATIPLAPWVFAASGHPPAIAALEVDYYQAVSWGIGAMVISAALSSFFTGRGDVRTVMLVDTFAALLNVVLDYAWIFGHLGFPEWGMSGAAWATVTAMWSRPVIYLLLALRPGFARAYGTISGCRFDRQLFGRLMWFGMPSGLQMAIEMTGFTLFLLLIGQLGDRELAATSLAFNVNSLAFMPVYGIGVATATLVGQRLGENRPDLAARATWSAFELAAGLMLLVSALYVLAPGWLLAAHARGIPSDQFDGLSEMTALLLRFVAFYCMFDAMNIVFASAIKGAGDTRFVLLATLVLSAIPSIGAWVGIRYLGYGLIWSWIVLSAWVCLLGVTFLCRFIQGKWRRMRVIEQADAPLPPVEEPQVLVQAELA